MNPPKKLFPPDFSKNERLIAYKRRAKKAPAPARAPAPALMWPAAVEPLALDLEADAEELPVPEPLAAAPPSVPEATVGVGVDLTMEVSPDEIRTVAVWLPTMTVLRPVVSPA